jgi:AcrR family transcriptional regulator
MGTTERREREREELREKILSAARDLFAAHGFEAVSMRKIAERIEYSPTAIYLHFADKDALLRELCQADFAAHARFFLKAAQVADPVERMCRLGRAYVEFALTYPSSYKLMFMTRLPPDPKGDAAGKGVPERDSYALVRATAQDCIDSGRVRPEHKDAELLAQTVWSAVHGVAALELAMGHDRTWVPWRPVKKRTEQLLEVVLRGMLREA